MGKRIEPRQVAMAYFATAPLEDVRGTLADVTAIVKARTGKPAPRTTQVRGRARHDTVSTPPPASATS